MNGTDQQYQVSWWARPVVLLVGMPVTVVLWLMLVSLYDDATLSQIWRSAVLGLLLGLLGVLANKVVVRRHLEFFVEFYLRPIPKNSPARSIWQRFVHALPFIGPYLASMILGEAYLQHFAAGMAAFNAAWLLTYPEQVLIYQAAEQRIAQL